MITATIACVAALALLLAAYLVLMLFYPSYPRAALKYACAAMTVASCTLIVLSLDVTAH